MKQKKILRAVRGSFSELRKQWFSRFRNETQEASVLDFDVKEKVAPVIKQRKTPGRFNDGSLPHAFPFTRDTVIPGRACR